MGPIRLMNGADDCDREGPSGAGHPVRRPPNLACIGTEINATTDVTMTRLFTRNANVGYMCHGSMNSVASLYTTL